MFCEVLKLDHHLDSCDSITNQRGLVLPTGVALQGGLLACQILTLIAGFIFQDQSVSNQDSPIAVSVAIDMVGEKNVLMFQLAQMVLRPRA